MFSKIVSLIQRTFPAPLDRGIFAEKEPAVEMDLSTPVLGGWLERINRYALEASRQRNAYQVDEDGFLMYEALIRARIIDQFHSMGIDVTRWQVNAILLDANGASDACTQIATACFKIQNERQKTPTSC